MASAGVLPAAARGDVLPPQIHTAAGGGTCSGLAITGGPCDGVKATSATIGKARSVSLMPDGSSYLFVDSATDLVREVSGGIVTTVAGGGTLTVQNNAQVLTGQTTDADGGSPLASGLDGPVSVAALPTGGFIITEYSASVIREVSAPMPDAPNGIITTIAGTGSAGHTVDAAPATQVALNYPTDAEPQADGSILVADTYNNVVRLVSPPAADGTRTAGTVTGGAGSCDDAAANCDGLPASSVIVHHPVAVSPIAGGGFLIAEYDTSAIREVTAAGTFETVAGTPGTAGAGGDGGPATSALLNHPLGVASLPDGGFLVADTRNERVRAVSPSGVITTLAGNGTPTYAGDGGAASAASLQSPDEAVPLPAGGALIADGDNGAIRRLTLAAVTSMTTSPATPDSTNGWFRVPPVTAVVKTTEHAHLRCEVDPLAAPPAYDAIPDSCPLAGSGGLITGDGVHTVWAASMNSFGDKENPVSFAVRIDSTPPTITCAGTPTFAFGDPNANVTGTVSDPLSGPAAPFVSGPADTSTPGPGSAALMGASNTGTNTVTNCPYLVVPDSFRYTPALSSHFRSGAHGATLDRLRVTHVAPGATVAVSCAGKGCPFAGRRVVAANRCPRRAPCRRAAVGRTVDAGKLFARAMLAPGARVLVTVMRPDTWGQGWVLTVPAHGAPTRRSGCLAPGSTALRHTCQRA